MPKGVYPHKPKQGFQKGKRVVAKSIGRPDANWEFLTPDGQRKRFNELTVDQRNDLCKRFDGEFLLDEFKGLGGIEFNTMRIPPTS